MTRRGKTGALHTAAAPESLLLPLARYLTANRRIVAGIYAVVLLGFAAVIIYPEVLPIPEVSGGWGRDRTVLVPAGILGVFILLQVAFVIGGGRIRLGGKGHHAGRVVVSIIIGAAMLGALSAAFLTTFLEYADRLGSDGAQRHGTLSRIAESGPYGIPYVLYGVEIVIGAWLIWGAILWLHVRRASSRTEALQRIARSLVVGSWVEFLVALAVQITVRRTRATDCPWKTGSWLSLAVSAPILVWSVGPAILLLFVSEMEKSGKEPHRLLRILVTRYERG